MTTLYYESELYHHGIKGMKWGVRRFQKKDGTLTPSGKKRYADDDSTKETKSKHRQKLEARYREQGMTKQQAEKAAEKRIKTEKIIAGTAALTVTAAAAYVAHKQIKYRADGIIKSGTKMQVISAEKDKNLDRAFYTAYDEKDKTKYKGLYGDHLSKWKGEAHKITLNADSNVKIVSRKKAEDTFIDLYKNDAEFRDAFHKSNEIMGNGFGLPWERVQVHKKASNRNMTDKELRKVGYDAFNIGLVNHDDNGNAVAKKFYDKLKEQGYDAVMDINDQKYSGYNSKKPVIVFNKANKISVSDVEKMSNDYIRSNAKKAVKDIQASAKKKETVEQLVTSMSVAGVYGGAAAGISVASKRSNAVAKYKKEHPNTKLTDKQIAMII